MTRVTRRDAVRLGGILAGTGVLFVGGLLVASSPALADNGVHIATSGNTTVDRCAGCHRAHTASDSYLLKSAQKDLCSTCHGSNATGAATDVFDGVAYTDFSHAGGKLGALRGGGFSYALIASTTGVNRTSIGALAVTAPVSSTSGHSVDGTAQVAWGQGAISATANTGKAAVALECGSCHDPHGNGAWRILKTLPATGEAIVTPKPVTIASISVASSTVAAGKGSVYYDVVTLADSGLKVTDPVTTVGTTPNTFDVLAGTVTTVTDGSHFQVKFSVDTTKTPPTNPTAALTGVGSGGTIGYGLPNSIAKIATDGSTWTVTTYNKHGFGAGQSIKIAGVVSTGTGTFNASPLLVAGVTPNSNVFTITSTAVPVYTSGGTISATGSTGFIPDALPVGTKPVSIYTTTNYWAVDDHNYTGANLTGTPYAAAGPSAVIENISQWCATCHTRYMAGSGAWDVNSGDKIFTFRHRSQSPGESSPNCLQCHVAHGSNASMTGTESKNVPLPDGTIATHTAVGGGSVPDSRLLRVDNRGTCNMCHNV